MKRISILIYCLAVCAAQRMYTERILTLFMRPYPKVQIGDIQRFVSSLTHPTKTARSTLKHSSQAYSVAGVMASYAGYLTFSDPHGQISFAQKHEASRIYLVVTTAITPILMMSNTIAHWELEVGTPAAFYLIERNIDPETTLTYWKTTALDIPDDNKIPLESIIIFDRPKDVYIPEGITPIKQTPNLVLPDIYLKQPQNAQEQALYLLNLRMFFGPVENHYRTEPTRYIKIITP